MSPKNVTQYKFMNGNIKSIGSKPTSYQTLNDFEKFHVNFFKSNVNTFLILPTNIE